jgi:hypothetical protein
MKRYIVLQIILLLGLLSLSIGIATGAQVNPGMVLARIELNDTTIPNLPMYAYLQDANQRNYALVIASTSELQASGASYQILDSDAASSDDYLVALERRTGARANASQVVSILHDDGRHIITRVPLTQIDALSALGFDLQRLSATPLVFRPQAQLHAPTAITPNPVIASMMAQVQLSTVSNYTAKLSGEISVTIGGSPYTIASRRTDAGTPIDKATQYVYEQMQTLGLTVSYHTWSACGLSNRNVIGQKLGQVRPNEIVLVVAHIDDQPSATYAPGADDNASGSVGVLVAAEILRAYQFERTIRFVFFTGEEQGMCGSRRYAAYVAGLGENIVAVYNLDMIAWDTGTSHTLRLHTRSGNSADQAIANTFVNVVNAYGASSNLSPIVTPDNESASDHSSFWNYGYPGILAIEDDYDDFNWYYHTTSDRLALLNVTYMTNYIKASVGTIAHLANYIAENGILRGAVTEAETSLPIANAYLQAISGDTISATQTNSNGIYTFTLPSGTYSISAYAPSHEYKIFPGIIVTSVLTTTFNITLAQTPNTIYLPYIRQTER